MKILKKSLLIPVCLALFTASSQAALVLEFREVGGVVELTYSGDVALLTPLAADTTYNSAQQAILSSGGVSWNTSSVSPTFAEMGERLGVDLLPGDLIPGIDLLSTGATAGLGVSQTSLLVGAGVLPMGGSVSSISGEVGGALFGVTQTFNTTFAASGLDTHASDTLIDLWRESGTVGTDNLVQFRINSTSVPEPSSALLGGIGLLALAARRKRKA